MSLPEAGYESEEGQLGSEISGAVSGVTTPGASRLQASQLQKRSATMQRLHCLEASQFFKLSLQRNDTGLKKEEPIEGIKGPALLDSWSNLAN